MNAADRRQLEVGDWDGRKFRWLKQVDGTSHELDIDTALTAARDLYAALRGADDCLDSSLGNAGVLWRWSQC
jgi:hypothetical protein